MGGGGGGVIMYIDKLVDQKSARKQIIFVGEVTLKLAFSDVLLVSM